VPGKLLVASGSNHLGDFSMRYRTIEDLEKTLNETKESEAQLRKMIDTIPTLAWCNLPDGSHEFLNQRWHDYTGLSPQEAQGWG
jgi:PAS domain-containing protein